jgi:hypothetical protein
MGATLQVHADPVDEKCHGDFKEWLGKFVAAADLVIDKDHVDLDKIKTCMSQATMFVDSQLCC